MRFSFFIVLLCLLLAPPATAQLVNPVPLPKRELRAAWVATVSNIDWPSKPGLSTDAQKAEALKQLDFLHRIGCNAVILQVRPAADAFFESAYEPWSRFLTGKSGAAPSPYYDPLKFWTEEAHRRGMELHAWFNPFRALTDSRKNPHGASHVTRQQPDWTISYGGKTYLDPGVPAARDYVVRVITDCARRYDIDAVHLDDYFYPYKVPGQEFGDGASYKKWGGAFPDKGNWRRANVNLFVHALHDSLRQAKPWMKLGISPFGIWRSSAKDSIRGSNTRPTTTTNYDDLFADALHWQEQGWTDYLMPQLYWERGHRSAPFETLLPWWNKWRYNRHVYYGLGVYRMCESKVTPCWTTPAEVLGQIRDIRKLGAATGYSFYSTASFGKIGPALADSLAHVYAPTIALPPRMPWIDSVAPPPPADLQVRMVPDGANELRWSASPAAKTEPVRYAVYRFAAGETVDLEQSSRLVALTTETGYRDNFLARDGSTPVYVVTALDRLWNESAPAGGEKLRQSRR